MASAGTVTLELDANSVKMIRELQKAQKQTKRSAARMRRDMTDAFKGIAAGAAILGGAFAAIAKKSVDLGDKIAKTADKLGVGTEALQELRFAAKRAGVEQNTLDMALQRFTRRAGEAANGTGEAKKALEEMGIVLRDSNGNIRATDDLLMDVADAMKQVQSPSDRLRLAFKLFDSEGAALVNMLRDGSDGLGEMRQKARDLGIVLSDDAVRGAEKAADKLGDLQEVLRARIAENVLQNADAIVSLAESITGLVIATGKAIREVPSFMQWLGESVAAFINGPALDDFVRREKEIADLYEDLKAARERGERDRADSGEMQARDRNAIWNLERQIALLEKKLRLDREAFEFGKTNMPMPKGATGTSETPAPPVLDPVGEDKSAEEIKQIISNLMSEVKSFGMSESDTALIKLAELGATDEQLAQYRQLAEQQRIMQSVQAEADANAEYRNELQREYNALFEQTRTPAEEHAAQLARIKEMWEEDIITAQEYLDLVHRINASQETHMTEAEMASKRMADTLASAGASAFAAWADGSKSAKEAFADMAKDMLRWLTMLIVKEAILAAFGYGSGSGGSFSLAGAFGGGKAEGGPIMGGQAYLVGEKGPELIVPRSSGYVVPNDKLGGGSNVTVNVDARESDDPSKLLALVPVIQAQIEQSIGLKSRRGYA